MSFVAKTTKLANKPRKAQPAIPAYEMEGKWKPLDLDQALLTRSQEVDEASATRMLIGIEASRNLATGARALSGVGEG